MPASTTHAVSLAACLCLFAPLAVSNIYRCHDAAGVALFSQFPCTASDDIETMVITSISVVSAAPLTKAEQATLQRMEAQFHRNRTNAAKDQRRARRRTTKNRAERSALCARSRVALKSLRERKRGGYSLSTARTLDGKEADLKAQVSEHC